MEILKDFTAIIFVVSLIMLACNIILFLVLVICIPTISSRIRNNTLIMDENSERIEKYLCKINRNLIRLNKNIEKNNKDINVDSNSCEVNYNDDKLTYYD